MDHRHGQRPSPVQRTVSSSYLLNQGLKRPPLPSRLSNVRSASQPINLVDLTADGARTPDVRTPDVFFSGQDKPCTSPDAIDLDEDDNGRPAKRAKLNKYGHRGGDERSDMETDTAHIIIPGSPLPQLRRPNASASANLRHRSRRTAVDRSARRANGLDPPPLATRLPAPRLVADFSPWSGQHPEDIMNETVVKAGYFDKPPGQNSSESNSAKPTIWPNLSQKNNMGLQTLSYLFTSVMDKRQALGKCIAPSTFKPPPRVTVTDTKREAWLRDLANPDVPLRKQSRTIPHGIRGKLLMEQCLSKIIPMPRAVWLAKCVGANELRAFRRKGVSGSAAATGEAKWIREWTMNVEQFLDGVITSCGQSGWKSKMDYALKLGTSFYVERLLERNHYLDWIVTAFAQAALDRLPIWIILVQLYWRDITSFASRGRKLAEAILDLLHRNRSGKIELNDMVMERLNKLTFVMAVTNRGCLIMPHVWEKYKYLLSPKTLRNVDVSLESPAENISQRNSRLTGPLTKTPQDLKCPLLQLYSVLDAVGLHVDSESLIASCTACISTGHKLVSALLDWAGSVYRAGLSRVYLAAVLIARLHDRGDDTDSAILDYLKTTTRTCSVNNVNKVVAELIRMKCFSTGRYLQWLMTSGILSSSNRPPLSTGILAALPIDTLPTHLVNTRLMLMRRLGLPQDDGALFARFKSIIVADADFAGVSLEKLVEDIKDYSIAAKLDCSRQLILQASTMAKEGDLSLHFFCLLREVIVQSEDISALADLVQAALYTDDTVLLATVHDTVNMYAHTFAATDRLQSLLDQLVERYHALRTQQNLDRTYILSVSVLVERFPERAHILQVLQNDLTICEQQNSMAVCSPASDNLVSMQASSLDSDHDIDSVFDSGNTMDEQLMSRVFNRIVQRASKPGQADVQAPSRMCRWLNQLRAVDSAGFDQLVKSYISAYLANPADSAVPCKVISAVMASTCLRFDSILDQAKETKTPSAASTAIRLFTSDNVVNPRLHASEVFRFRLQQQRFVSESAAKIIPLLATAAEDPGLQVDDQGLIRLMLDYAITDREESTKVLGNSIQNAADLANRSRLTQHMMRLGSAVSSPSTKVDAASVIALANPLSIVHCAAALLYLSQAEPQTDLQGPILDAISTGCEVWPQLLESAGQETIKGIYQSARERIFGKVLRQDEDSTSQETEVSRYLDILEVAYHSAKEEDNVSLIVAISDKLKQCESRLWTADATDSESQEINTQTTCCINALLRLSILYGTVASSDSDSLRLHRTNLLAILCALIIHPKLQTQPDLVEYIHDVACTIADTVSPDSLSALAKSPIATKDARLAFILGASPSPDAWLALVSHPQQSQQQRVLMKPQQQHARPVPPQSPASSSAAAGKTPVRAATATETKTVPFPLRRWEIISDATPTMGENDTCLSLALFGARKV